MANGEFGPLLTIRYPPFAIRQFAFRHSPFARSKKGGGTPADAIHPLAASADAARVHADKCTQVCAHKIHATRSPVGVPPRLLLRRTNATAQLRPRASWDLVGAHNPDGSKDRALLNGRYPLLPVPVQRAPRRPVVVPAGRIPEAARERSANPPAGTAPTPPSGLPPEGVPSERDSIIVTELRTNVKGVSLKLRRCATAEPGAGMEPLGAAKRHVVASDGTFGGRRRMPERPLPAHERAIRNV